MKRFALIVLLICLAPLYSTLYAQNTESVAIKEITHKERRPWITNISVYGFWHIGGGPNELHTAFNSQGNTKTFVSAANLGVSAEFKKGFWVSILTNLGYEKLRYDTDRKLSFTQGIVSDWITLDAAISSSIAGGLSYYSGFQGKLLLANRNISKPDICYDGIPFDCYNRIAFSWFFGADISFNFASLFGRIGVDIVPMLNSDRISYYNLTRIESQIARLYFVVGVKFRIFTTKVKLNSQQL